MIRGGLRPAHGKTTKLAGPVDLEVVPLRKGGALEGAEPKAVAAFWKRIATLSRSVSAPSQSLSDAQARLDRLELALDRSQAAPEELDDELDALRKTLSDLRTSLYGSPTKGELNKRQPHTVSSRLNFAADGTRGSTYGPTPEHEKSLRLAEKGFGEIRSRLNQFLAKDLPAFEKRLQAAGAPWSAGQPIP